MRFRDRREGGQMLAGRLSDLAAAHPIVLALPRGGVPVGAEVARLLGAELEVLVSRKLGAPDQPELGVGAIAEGGALYVDEAACSALAIPAAAIERIAVRESRQVERLVRRFRGGRPLPALAGRTVILIDDGLATGGTARAAIRAARAARPATLVFATPVGARDSVEALRPEVDRLECVLEPEDLIAIGLWYADFRQVGDEEVLGWLHPEVSDRPGEDDLEGSAVAIPTRGATLAGELAIRPGARGLVVFTHGASRQSHRHRFVAHALRDAGFGTLLLDLLTANEEAIDARSSALRYDIALLGARMTDAVDWLARMPAARGLPIACFGASTGAAAALVAAAVRPELVRAVVSRGGRPDLAGADLASVRAPTLLLVGGEDTEVLAQNRAALVHLGGDKELIVIPGATHRFEQPGSLEEAARLAADWFSRHLPSEREPASL